MITLACPHCDETIQIPERHAGQSRMCSGCGRQLLVPEEKSRSYDGEAKIPQRMSLREFFLQVNRVRLPIREEASRWSLAGFYLAPKIPYDLLRKLVKGVDVDPNRVVALYSHYGNLDWIFTAARMYSLSAKVWISLSEVRRINLGFPRPVRSKKGFSTTESRPPARPVLTFDGQQLDNLPDGILHQFALFVRNSSGAEYTIGARMSPSRPSDTSADRIRQRLQLWRPFLRKRMPLFSVSRGGSPVVKVKDAFVMDERRVGDIPWHMISDVIAETIDFTLFEPMSWHVSQGTLVVLDTEGETKKFTLPKRGVEFLADCIRDVAGLYEDDSGETKAGGMSRNPSILHMSYAKRDRRRGVGIMLSGLGILVFGAFLGPFVIPAAAVALFGFVVGSWYLIRG